MPPMRERELTAGEAPSGRWQRRARRRDAERQRIPKHGKSYVTLVERMLVERAQRSATTSATPARKRARRGPVRPPRA